MNRHCLERNKTGAMNETINVGTLSEPEWVFVFERVAALGRKGKKQGSYDYFVPEGICSLDLRYIARLVIYL